MTGYPPNDLGPAPVVTGRRVAPGAGSPHEFTYSIVTADAARRPAEHADRRIDKRIRTRLREGWLLASRGDRGGCWIRDRSRVGARLRLESDRPLPKTFVLVDPSGARKLTVVLAWQKGRDAGVRFVPDPDLR